MERLPHFTKHYMTETDLVALLESRGLVISDEAAVGITETCYGLGFALSPRPQRKCRRQGRGGRFGESNPKRYKRHWSNGQRSLPC